MEIGDEVLNGKHLLLFGAKRIHGLVEEHSIYISKPYQIMPVRLRAAYEIIAN